MSDNHYFRSLYSLPNFQFVIPEPVLRGKFDIVQAEENNNVQQNALRLNVNVGEASQVVTLLGGKGFSNDPKKSSPVGLDFYLTYGSLTMELPFAIQLNDFIAEKYPGTENSYSSLESKVTVKEVKDFNYAIYMNQGYWIIKVTDFFQSSFDPDERGTILSVNHDWWGTYITYTGYMLLYLSMLGFLYWKYRFKALAKAIDKIKARKAALVFLTLFGLNVGFAQNHLFEGRSKINFDSLVKADAFPQEQAEKFGALIIQDLGGRMKPANTFSSELLRKVSKSDTYEGLNSDQVLLSILNGPAIWYNIPIIYLKRGNDSIRAITGVGENDKYAPLISFFDQEGNYKIATQLEEAYRAGIPNQFQKDFIEVDRRVNLLYSALEGKVLRIFPIPDDENNKWVSYPELEEAQFTGTDSLYVSNVLPLYFRSLRLAKTTQDYTEADELLESLKGFQQRYGDKVLPSEDRIQVEITYNKYDIFKKLFSWYLYVGLLFSSC